MRFYNKIERSLDKDTQEYLNKSVGKTGEVKGEKDGESNQILVAA